VVPGAARDFWALRDVETTVDRGEVVGVIGANGAGKSTLLKILARITEPTSGEARMRGRVGSLLEVGTGFHPELTGRENIFLSGSILGMRRREIRRRLDAIVDFAGVDAFLDTPVKRFSSGMRVRLGFAVAAHLDPEILLIDEVLAVGDAAFQKKCLGKMDEVARAGRTVLFVSHNMGAVTDLCDRCIHLQAGRIAADAPTAEVVRGYLQSTECSGRVDLRQWNVDRRGAGPMRLALLQSENEAGRLQSEFRYREPLQFRLRIESERQREAILAICIRDAAGHPVLHPHTRDDKAEIIVHRGTTEVTVSVEENLLNDGTYYATVWLGDGLNLLHDRVANCLAFTVRNLEHGTIRCDAPIRVPAHWSVEDAPAG